MSNTRRILSLQRLISRSKFNHRSLSTNILDSGLKDVDIPKVSLPEFVFTHCEKYKNFTALECATTGRKYSYDELIKKSINLGKSLRKKLNLNRNDVVAVLLPNVPEFPIAILGIMNAGLIATTLNPSYTAEEISRQLQDSSAKAVITLVENWDTALQATNHLKRNLPIITIKTAQNQSLPQNAIDFKEFVDNSVDFPLPINSHDDVASLPYSSGTTGLPKGVQLTHLNLVANLCQNASPELPLLEEASQNHQDILPLVLPMFHIYGFNVNTFFPLLFGSKLVTISKFTREDYVSVLRKHKPHALFVVPPIVLFLASDQMVKREDLASVRATLSGAAPLGALDEQRFVEKAGKNVYMLQGYGLTETSPVVTVVSTKLKVEVNTGGSIGRPLPNTLIKVVDIDDPNRKPLGPNMSGELLVKGPQVMKGYLNKPEENKITIVDDGWLRTGDLVHYNEDKIVFVTDRLKELIKVKGFQVAPAELEEIIRDFPGIADAAVIGVPDARQGEAPRAYIVAKKGVKINENDLYGYVKDKVASFKQLKGGIEIVEAIPKNASGKIMRRTLKLEFLEKTQK